MISYSKIILFLKVTFFITAIFILGILFVISPPDKFGEPVKVSKMGLEKNIAFSIIGAKLRGATEVGHRFDFMVDAIDPGNNRPRDFSLTNLKGTLSIQDKDIYTISAEKAFISSTDKFIDLIGNLSIRTESGISGKSQKIRLVWDSVDRIVSNEVELATPLGKVFGGRMKISIATLEEKQDTKIYLENGVKLVFIPITEKAIK